MACEGLWRECQVNVHSRRLLPNKNHSKHTIFHTIFAYNFWWLPTQPCGIALTPVDLMMHACEGTWLFVVANQTKIGGKSIENPSSIWKVFDVCKYFQDESLYGCFPKIGVGKPPQIINFNRVFHYKPSILGYPYFWKHPYYWDSSPN